MAIDLDKIRALADRAAASHGFEVVEVEFLGDARHRLLRVFIEKDAKGRANLQATETENWKLPGNVPLDQLAGITVDDCQTFSGDFGTLLDVEDLIPGAKYTLEVSSPGLNRKLQKPEDYERFAGNLVKLRTAEPIDGTQHWQGRIGKVTGEGLELELNASGGKKGKAPRTAGKSVRIAFSNILKANLVPEI